MTKSSEYIYDHPMYYDVLFGWDRSKEILFVDKLAQSYQLKGRKFLECACGTGTVARQMAFLGWDVLGLDLSSAMVDAMNREMSALGQKKWAVCADMTKFSMPERFDLVYCPLGSIGLLPSDQSVIDHFKCVRTHLSDEGIYVVDVGLQKSLKEPSKPLDLKDLVWAMEVEGIYVEASEGTVKVEDDMKNEQFELKWDAVPTEFNFTHLKQLIESGGMTILDIYPQAGTDESGIPMFDLEQKGYEEGQDRVMLILK